jgi:hypothetical protein
MMVAERASASEGTARAARRDLHVRRARSMGDSNERGDERKGRNESGAMLSAGEHAPVRLDRGHYLVGRASVPPTNRPGGGGGTAHSMALTRARKLGIAALSIGLAAVLVFAIVWSEDPLLFVKQSLPVTLVGIDRTVSYEGNATGYVSGNLTSGCNVCPLSVHAGSTVTVVIGEWIANATSTPGRVVLMNWSVVSPYPFDAFSYIPPTPPLVYSWHDTVTVGPYGNGGFGISLTIVIPYSYSNLPPTGNITFTLIASTEQG